MDFAKILVKFAHVIEINEETKKKSRLDCARMRVRCESTLLIPKEFSVVIGGQLCVLKIKIIAMIDSRSQLETSQARE